MDRRFFKMYDIIAQDSNRPLDDVYPNFQPCEYEDFGAELIYMDMEDYEPRSDYQGAKPRCYGVLHAYSANYGFHYELFTGIIVPDDDSADIYDLTRDGLGFNYYSAEPLRSVTGGYIFTDLLQAKQALVNYLEGFN